MAKRLDKERAITLRKEGYSYSKIKEIVNVSKGTLSRWLHEFPLSNEQIKDIENIQQKKIERYRNTMRQKRDIKLQKIYSDVSTDIGILNNKDIFTVGFFLFWGEGGKTMNGTTSLSNTTPLF